MPILRNTNVIPPYVCTHRTQSPIVQPSKHTVYRGRCWDKETLPSGRKSLISNIPSQEAPWNGLQTLPWAFLADTATLYLYPTGWQHIAEVSCTLLQGNICFMQLEHLVRKKTVEENRARVRIRICVICMFYKLSIGGFRMSAHFFAFYLSG